MKNPRRIKAIKQQQGTKREAEVEQTHKVLKENRMAETTEDLKNHSAAKQCGCGCGGRRIWKGRAADVLLTLLASGAATATTTGT